MGPGPQTSIQTIPQHNVQLDNMTSTGMPSFFGDTDKLNGANWATWKENIKMIADCYDLPWTGLLTSGDGGCH